MSRLVLYGTEGCHLCEEAERLLAEGMRERRDPPRLFRVDIASDDALLERYGVRIPVVRDPDRELELDWPFDAEALDALLAAAAPTQPMTGRR